MPEPSDMVSSDGKPAEPTPLTGGDKPRLKIKGADEVGGVASGSHRGQYFLLRDGSQEGPFSRETVVSLIQSALASPQDLAWSEGNTGWRSLGDLFPGVRPLVRPPERIEAQHERLDVEIPRFSHEIFASLSYPFRGDGAFIMGVAVGVMVLLWGLGNLLGRLSFFAYLPGLWLLGYLFGALQNVVKSSAQGDSELPKWPEWHPSFSEAVRPLSHWISCQLVCFLPALVASIVAANNGSETCWGLAFAFFLGGAVYFPMALMAVAMGDSVEAMDPVFIYRSIRAVGWDYLLLLSVLFVLVLTHYLGNLAMGQVPMSGIQVLWSTSNTVYFSMVLARMIGVYYRSHQRDLGWF